MAGLRGLRSGPCRAVLCGVSLFLDRAEYSRNLLILASSHRRVFAQPPHASWSSFGADAPCGSRAPSTARARVQGGDADGVRLWLSLSGARLPHRRRTQRGERRNASRSIDPHDVCARRGRKKRLRPIGYRSPSDVQYQSSTPPSASPPTPECLTQSRPSSTGAKSDRDQTLQYLSGQ